MKQIKTILIAALVAILVSQSILGTDTIQYGAIPEPGNFSDTWVLSPPIGLRIWNDIDTADDLATASALPRTFDLRDVNGHNYLNDIRDQGDCGSCYAFGLASIIEGYFALRHGMMIDVSEEHLKECCSLAGCAGGSCSHSATLATIHGIVMEDVAPYHDHNTECDPSWEPVYRITDWGRVSMGATPDIDTLKYYIYNYGPMASNIDVRCIYMFDGCEACYGDWLTNRGHIVTLVGWDDNLEYPGGSGAWLVRNSYGIDEDGAQGNGYFYVAYGHANAGKWGVCILDHEPFNPYARTLQHDYTSERDRSLYSNNEGWGMSKFHILDDESLIEVGFDTTGTTSDVDVYVYKTFDGNAPSNRLYAAEDISYFTPGYHGVDIPSLDVDGDVYIVLHITNVDSIYDAMCPIPVSIGRTAKGTTFQSVDGSPGSWVDLEQHFSMCAMRIRVEQNIPCGDVNCDRIVDDADVDALFAWYVNPCEGNALCNEWAGDVNHDNILDIQDVMMLLQHVGNGYPDINCRCGNPPPPPPPPVCGDIDGDQDVDSNDVHQLLRWHSTHTDADKPHNECTADVNGDGAINMQDVMMLFYYVEDGIPLDCGGCE